VASCVAILVSPGIVFRRVQITDEDDWVAMIGLVLRFLAQSAEDPVPSTWAARGNDTRTESASTGTNLHKSCT
jgi:hypothetical protein